LILFSMAPGGVPAAKGSTLEASEPPRAAAAADLPLLGEIEVDGVARLAVRGELSADRARALLAEIRAVATDARARFLPAAPAGLGPIDVCLLSDTRAYQTFLERLLGPRHGENALGLYSPYRRLVAANLSQPLGNLRHELAHALANDALGPLPAWLDEGMASLYNQASRSKAGRLRLGTTYRLDQLRAARASGTLPDLDALARSTAREVYGARSRAFYSLGRFLMLHLDEREQLRPFLKAFVRAPRTAAGQRAVLREFIDWPAFLAWTDTLDPRP
jgi:hypothetical protein